MTTTTSARIRALSIITVAVIVILIFLSSAVQATGGAPETESYRVKPGDTLWHIAQKLGPENGDTRRIVAAIQELNSIKASDLKAGQVIEVPVHSSES